MNTQQYIDKLMLHKPLYLKKDNFIDYLYGEIASNPAPRKTLSMIHFTDLHVDLEYLPGSNKKCKNAMCCRQEDGMATDPENAAGPYGSLALCDVPQNVLYKMGDKINELQPDVLFWTGDVVPHDQWQYSLEHTQKYSKFLADYMQQNLPWSTYPLEGNHDFGVTINSQDFTITDPMITYNLELWKVWLTEDAQKQFAVNGFYSQKLKTSDGTVYDKVRVIAVNTEACYNANFFLMKLRDDPGDQLAWLEQTLYEMEANGEIGILLGHVPPGSNSCLENWSKRYQALMDRFQNVVRFNLFGHVHKEIHNTIRAV